MSKPPARILLVQLYANGDCLYATAIARQIRYDYPGCHLTWLIADFCQSIIAGNPDVDEVRVTSEVRKNDAKAFRQLKRKVMAEKEQGLWDEVFITQTMDENQALYDGTVRGMIFRAYPSPLVVPVEPVLVLSETEKQRVAAFADTHRLAQFRNIILWEYAPQSGQNTFDFGMVKRVATRLSQTMNVAIILSSAQSFERSATIIDASTLTVRENAALTHFCTLLIGCSSGITWLSTSSAAKRLPMLQLLDGYAYFRNAPSVDFARYGLPDDQLIELVQFDEDAIVRVTTSMISEGIPAAKEKFNQSLPVQFRTTAKIVYNLLCYAQFNAVRRHYRVTVSVYGKHPLFLKTFYSAIFFFPFRLVANKFRKWTR